MVFLVADLRPFATWARPGEAWNASKDFRPMRNALRPSKFSLNSLSAQTNRAQRCIRPTLALGFGHVVHRRRDVRFGVHKRSTTARGSPIQASTLWATLPSLQHERDRHLEIRPVSQLNTWPVVSPVNASRRPSPDAVHHSGLGQLARPFPWGAHFPRGLSPPILCQLAWRTSLWVTNGLCR
jgi:hypothetical protein